MPTKVPETPTSQALKKSAVARYLQLASLFRARIESGEWEVDSRIPTVEELARDCGVATMTIRQALDILEAEGLIERFGRRVYDGSALKVGVATLADRGLQATRALRVKKEEQLARSAAATFALPTPPF